MANDMRRTRGLLDERMEFVQGDIRSAELGETDAVVILDVLHYLDFPSQDDLLERVRDALAPDGILLMRVGDASGGLRFKISNVVDHLVTFARGHRIARFHCRAVHEWQAMLNRLGFSVESMPMSRGTPFANVLLVARSSPCRI